MRKRSSMAFGWLPEAPRTVIVLIVRALRAAVLASCVATSSCGGASSASAGDNRAQAHLPSARAVAMTSTPGRALASCRAIRVLRNLCPTQVPAGGHPGAATTVCGATGTSSSGKASIVSLRCTAGEWSYTTSSPLPGTRHAKSVGYSSIPPPPWFVHVDISAARGGRFCGWPHEMNARHINDALLGHGPVSFGSARWFDTQGRLALAPQYPEGGEVGGHLAFCGTANGVGYAITLHAWKAGSFHYTIDHASHTITVAGPSLPRVVATLRAIVQSTAVAEVRRHTPRH